MTKLVNHHIRQALFEMIFIHFSYITAYHKKKICHNLKNSKKCNTDSKESFQHEVSEYPGPKDYLASKNKVGYRIFF